MRYLLDTHTLLWMFHGDPHLSQAAAEAILSPANELFFSLAGYWEICLKYSLGKLTLKPGWPQVLDREMARNGIQWLPIQKEHLLGVLDLPFLHRDPFDRLLVAQARHEQMVIKICTCTTYRSCGKYRPSESLL